MSMHFFKLFYLISTLLIGISINGFSQIFTDEPVMIEPEFEDAGGTGFIHIEDLGSDGLLDILIQIFPGPSGFTQFKNKGHFQFERLSSFNASNARRGMSLFDFENDGTKDIIYSTTFGDIYQNAKTGDNEFNSERELIFNRSQNGNILAFSEIFSDVDLDGDFDIIISYFQEKKIVWRENNGNGFFINEKVIYEDENDSDNPFYGIRRVDIGNDGIEDFVCIDGHNSIFVFENDAFGNFSEGKILYSSPYTSDLDIYSADLNNDNLTDFIVVSRSNTLEESGILGSITQIDNGNFNPFDSINYRIKYPHIHLADFDGDGDIDISSAGRASNTTAHLVIHENNGEGEFTPITISKNEFYTQYLSSGDFDLDGDLDIIISTRGENSIYSFAIFENLSGLSKIQSCIYFDENNNGIKDVKERGLKSFSTFLEPISKWVFPDSLGCSTFIVDSGTYELKPNTPSKWQLSTDLESYDIQVNNDNFSGFDFGVIPKDTLLDGQMQVVSGITRCSQDTKFDFTFQNQGTTIITEGIIWVSKNSLTEIANQINPLDTIVDNELLGWKFDSLYPGETVQRSIIFEMPGISQGVNPGTLINIASETQAKNSNGSESVFRNLYSQPILCAYDPNDKLVSPDRGGEDNYTFFEDTLIYTVRFQNTGNDTAFTVILRDTLDENLDVSTISILATSHREIIKTEIEKDRYITFTFKDILLPDSTINFNGSQGYVSYSIQPKDGLDENTIIKNTASIYFDFNPPIVTNTTQNTLVECIPIDESNVIVTIQAGESYTLPDGTIVDEAGTYTTQILDERNCPTEIITTTIELLTSVDNLTLDKFVSIYPNPINNVFYLDIESNSVVDYELKVLNIIGQEISKQNIKEKTNTIYIKGLESGVYFIQLWNKSEKLVASKKLIVL